MRVNGREVVVGRTFGDAPPGGLVIYEDSAGEVAIAVNGGSAAELLDVRAGDELRLSGMSLGEPREHYETVDLDERTRAAAGRDRRAARRARHRRRADRRPRPPGAQLVHAPGQAIAASLVLRDYDDLLPLRAGLAVADVVGPSALVKWPNDVWLDGSKVAGILVEARQDPGWAVLGIGVNVAVDPTTLPPDAAEVAGTLGLSPDDVEPTLTRAARGARAAPGRGVAASRSPR